MALTSGFLALLRAPFHRARPPNVSVERRADFARPPRSDCYVSSPLIQDLREAFPVLGAYEDQIVHARFSIY